MDNIKTQIETTIKKGTKEIQTKVRQQVLAYIIAGLGLITGLAWNEAIKDLIEYLFPLNKNTLLAKFTYAILITLVVVLLTIYLTKLLGKRADENK